MTGCNPNHFHPVSCLGEFDLSLIFEQSILTILPASLFLILGLIRSVVLCSRKSKSRYDVTLALKTAIALTLLALHVSLCVLWSIHAGSRLIVSLPAAGVSLAASVMICVLVILEHIYSVRPSGVIVVYLLLTTLFDIAQTRSLFLLGEGYETIASILAAIVGVKTLLLLLENRSKRRSLRKPYDGYPSEALSGPLTFSLLIWLNTLFRTGWRKLMTIDDLFKLDIHLDSVILTSRMKASWESRGHPVNHFTLAWTVVRCFKVELLIVAIPRLCLIGFSYAQPFLIHRAVSLLAEPRSAKSDDIGYGLIGATFFIYVGMAISTLYYQHLFYRVITMFRGAMVGLIYEHTLVIWEGAHSEGSAITLMSTDIESIISALHQINEVWARLVEIAIGIWLLARQLGVPCIVPILLVLFCVVGQGWVAFRIGDSQKDMNDAIEKRVSVTSSMLNKIRAVKMMGLSHVLSKTIQALRIRELYLCTRLLLHILYVNIFATLPPVWAPIITFVAFTIQSVVRGEPRLGTAQAFTSLSLISLVTSPALMLLATLPICAAAMGAFSRLQKFLLIPVLNESNVMEDSQKHLGSQQDHAEKVDHVTISVGKNGATDKDAIVLTGLSIRPIPTSDVVLEKLNLTVKRNTFTCIIGPVGSGKTLFLKSLLRELEPAAGLIDVVSGHVSYCGQTAWLKNATVQQNICNLGRDEAIDDRWYQSVLHACALNQDLALMPNGDLTLIGTGGIKLSGGQKARVALARALYARNELVLLDDVLSALDVKTAETVIMQVFGTSGLLRSLGATTMLVTHSARVLPSADSIMIFDGVSRNVKQGSLGEMQQLGLIDKFLTHDIEKQAELNQEKESAKKAPIPVVTEEAKVDYTRRIGDLSVYKYYAQSIGSRYLIVFCVLCLCNAFAMNFPQVVLKYWTDEGGEKLSLYLTLYVLLAAAATACNAGALWILFLKIVPTSAARLHAILLKAVMDAPLSFFASTDAGEVLNRFSQDMSLIDLQLPSGFAGFAMAFAGCIVQAALISTGSGYVAITLPFVFVVLYMIQDVYLKTSRQLRLLDLEAKSPLYTQFSETTEGIITIRAFGWQADAMGVLMERLNTSQRPYYALFCVQRWLTLVLDLLVAGLAVCVIALSVTLRSTTDPGRLGIAMNNILTFSTTLSTLVTAWTTFEISLGAIARVKSFASDTPSERSPERESDPPADWPTHGRIEFQNVSSEHAQGKPAIKNISMSILPGQRIGICGRTGSGKSSLVGTLLRLLDITDGSIKIDGVDITGLPRETARQQLLAVPQDACVLPGTVRFNIDPFERIPDEAIIMALTKVRLWEAIEERGGLEGELSSQPLSQGQLQLFCLARALVGATKIVLLDEATSNVDSVNDRIIQQVLREELKDKVVIVVAHRIETILDSDVIAVMDEGRLVEFDSPANLLGRDSIFKKLHDS